ncbi:hypothetical protein [Aureimonas psammosilenae]|uniref:hypothetical protein n=1 Tax=Aureimonas psammosilenae TaxID=2495496 RepID=UPI001260B130|nr:hypothetical protein [Aureimonas psammosilenae]
MSLPTNKDIVPPARPAVPKHVEETVKLTGTFVNNIAVGITLSGGVVPLIGLALGSLPAGTSLYLIVGVSAVCIFAGTVLHFLARHYVRQELSR